MSEFESSFKSDRDSAMNLRMFKHRVRVRVRTVKKRISFSDIFAIKLANSSILGVRRWPYFVQDIFLSRLTHYRNPKRCLNIPTYVYGKSNI